jgi:uncharacterized membrane protein
MLQPSGMRSHNPVVRVRAVGRHVHADIGISLLLRDEFGRRSIAVSARGGGRVGESVAAPAADEAEDQGSEKAKADDGGGNGYACYGARREL